MEAEEIIKQLKTVSSVIKTTRNHISIEVPELLIDHVIASYYEAKGEHNKTSERKG